MFAREQQVSRSRTLAIGAAQAVFWTVLCLALTVAASSVWKVFNRAGVQLPAITTAVLDFTLFLRHYWHVGLAGARCWPLVNWGMVWVLSRAPEAFILRRL